MIDKAPPIISGMPAGGCTLFPPNHKLVQMASVAAKDAVSGLAPGSFTVIGTRNDATNGEIAITGGATGFNVQLRADKGVIYTLAATATDLAGNSAAAVVTCSVPHDQASN